MKFFRGTAIYLLGAGLFFTLFLLAYFFVFSQVTANPVRVKAILKDSGIYARIPEVIYDDSVDSESVGSASIPLKNPEVRQTALDTFDPGFVQKNMEKVIDGTYAWLDGQTREPRFEVNLKDAKGDFATSLGDAAAKRLKGLPVCSAKQRPKTGEIDVFSSPCLPPGTDIQALIKQTRLSAKNNDNFLKDTRISPATIKDSSGKPAFENYPDVPKAYRTAAKLPYILLVFCVLLAAGVVFLSEHREAGLKRVGKLLGGAGILIVFLPFLINRLISGLLGSSPDDKVVNELVLPVLHEFAKTAGKFYFVMGAVYVLVAAGIFLHIHKMPVNKLTKKKA